MVIGHGLLAKVFNQYINDSKILIFDSEVSNSSEIKESEFEKEKELLIKTINGNLDKKIIYFSTCAMYDSYTSENLYLTHKLRMEEIIKKNCNKFLIFRKSQIFDKSNKSQLIGFLFYMIKNNNNFDLYDIERNIISLKEIKLIVSNIISNNVLNNKIINIANPNNINVIALVNKIEKLLNKKANYKLIIKQGKFNIDISDIRSIVDDLELFGNNYIDNLIKNSNE